MFGARSSPADEGDGGPTALGWCLDGLEGWTSAPSSCRIGKLGGFGSPVWYPLSTGGTGQYVYLGVISSGGDSGCGREYGYDSTLHVCINVVPTPLTAVASSRRRNEMRTLNQVLLSNYTVDIEYSKYFTIEYLP